MKKIFITITFLFSQMCIIQNLVNKLSFENMVAYPFNNTHIDLSNWFRALQVDDVKVSAYKAIENTRIKTYSNNSSKIFPNSARDWIVLEGEGIKSVAILNALGSEIGYYPTTASTLRHQINFGKLSCGVYFLKINMIDDTFQIQNFLFNEKTIYGFYFVFLSIFLCSKSST